MVVVVVVVVVVAVAVTVVVCGLLYAVGGRSDVGARHVSVERRTQDEDVQRRRLPAGGRQQRQNHRRVLPRRRGRRVRRCPSELSMGPFCVIQSNPTHQLTDPTQSNPLQVETFGPNPNPTQPSKLTIELTV